MSEKVKHENQVGASRRKSLRLWPGVLLVTLQWLCGFVLPALVPGAMIAGVFGGLLFGLAIIIWWCFFSRASWIERLGAIILMTATFFITSLFLDESIATGNMGLMFTIYSIPVMTLAFVGWAVATRKMSVLYRRMTMIITIVFASGLWILLRSDGIKGNGRPNFTWRWSLTREDRLLAQSGNEPSAGATSKAIIPDAEWPGFRGTNRDGIVRSVQINTHWSATPPAELWRRPVGPGCSSFVVNGNMLYTQEQRGESEIVSCYDLLTGKPVWKHEDKARFYDSHAGAGPRATPTLAGGRICSLGATGILNALDAGNGSVIWTHNAATDAGVKPQTWGFTGSPLVVGNIVIVALSGKLAAYDIETGKPLWSGPDGGASYSSPQLATIGGIPQVLLTSGSGIVSVEPVGGKALWDYSWPNEVRILQPVVFESKDLLITNETKELRCLEIAREGDRFKLTERWTSSAMKANFNDHVICKGYAYGFDGPSIACIDLKDGKRMWRGNRYQGWLLLLEDQDLLLVLSEKGELALVKAAPDRFSELSRFPAIKGKTWNHPVLAGNILVVRNAQEMAAFRLPSL